MRSHMPNPFPGVDKVKIIKNNHQLFKSNKCGNNGVNLTIILDESSSMTYCYDKTISGLNEYILSQKTDEKCFFNLVKFSGSNVTNQFTDIDIHQVPIITSSHYCPRGSTNLLDAIGSTINKIDSELEKIEESNRPAVIICIITDGEENSSKEFSYERIKQMISHRKELNWGFLFLGANIDSFSAASNIGINAAMAANFSQDNIDESLKVMSVTTSKMRSYYSSTHSFSASDFEEVSKFTDAERKKLLGDNNV